MKKVSLFVFVPMFLFLITTCNKKDTVSPKKATSYSSDKLNNMSSDQMNLANCRFPDLEGNWSCITVEHTAGYGPTLLTYWWCNSNGTECGWSFTFCWKIMERINPGVNPGSHFYRAIITLTDQATGQIHAPPQYWANRTILPPTQGINKTLILKEGRLYYSQKDQGYPVILREL